MKKLLGFLFPLFFMFPTALASGLVYDDFSENFFDNSKWSVENGTGVGLLDIYGIDRLDGVYHTEQKLEGDRSILLNMTRLLSTGDSIDYDVHYLYQSGNVISRIWINGNSLDLRCRDVDRYFPGKFGTTCDIGWWGSNELGNEFGIYHVRIVFDSYSANITIVKPDGSHWSHLTHQIEPPYVFGVETRTGENGITYIDYDNFVINSEEILLEKVQEKTKLNFTAYWNISLNNSFPWPHYPEPGLPFVIYNYTGDICKNETNCYDPYSYTPIIILRPYNYLIVKEDENCKIEKMENCVVSIIPSIREGNRFSLVFLNRTFKNTEEQKTDTVKIPVNNVVKIPVDNPRGTHDTRVIEKNNEDSGFYSLVTFILFMVVLFSIIVYFAIKARKYRLRKIDVKNKAFEKHKNVHKLKQSNKYDDLEEILEEALRNFKKKKYENFIRMYDKVSEIIVQRKVREDTIRRDKEIERVRQKNEEARIRREQEELQILENIEELKKKERTRRENLREKMKRVRKEWFEKLQKSKGLVKYTSSEGNEKWGKPEEVRSWKETEIGLEDNFSSMSPFEFERFISKLFEKMGYRNVRTTKKSGDDGIDIMAEKGKTRLAIQVKKWKNSPVGNEVIQNTLGAMHTYRATKCMVITTSSFTRQAISQARRSDKIDLWDGRNLREMVRKYFIDN